MKVGIFDHVERADRPIATTLDERLKFAAAADEAGIYGLHVAEHHATPLSLAPSPIPWAEPDDGKPRRPRSDRRGLPRVR